VNIAQPNPPQPGNYQFGHDSAVTKLHAQHAAAKCASYLLPHIKPRHKILDIGCGPGSITIDFAALGPEESVLGIDSSSSVVEVARTASTERNVQNNEFKIRDAYNVDAEDGTFDVVHYHQLLIQLSNLVKASKEMKRVCKFGACCF
jgi:ubiquinone/menaquinone biosynthesis C-methylase UbiE